MEIYQPCVANNGALFGYMREPEGLPFHRNGKTGDSAMIPLNAIKIRPLLPTDEAFSFQVYASTRTEEMQLVDWSTAQKEAFLRMQFDAQTKHYRIHYPGAKYKIIQRCGVSIGRLIVDRSAKYILLIDIAFLPEHRGTGLGTLIIKDLMQAASLAGVPLVLRVEFFNPAIRLYARLGFVKTREVNSVYQEMVWTPEEELCSQK